MQVGDGIGIAGNHWDGFSKGTNRKTGVTGLFPSYKVENTVVAVSMPTYPQVPRKLIHKQDKQRRNSWQPVLDIHFDIMSWYIEKTKNKTEKNKKRKEKNLHTYDLFSPWNSFTCFLLLLNFFKFIYFFFFLTFLFLFILFICFQSKFLPSSVLWRISFSFPKALPSQVCDK